MGLSDNTASGVVHDQTVTCRDREDAVDGFGLDDTTFVDRSFCPQGVHMIGMQTDLARTGISQAFRRPKACIGCVSGNMDLSLSSNTLYSVHGRRDHARAIQPKLSNGL